MLLGERRGDERTAPSSGSGQRAIVAGVGLCVIAAAALWLPWWEASRRPVVLGRGPARGVVEQWSGTEIVGAGRSVAVVLLVLAAVVVVAWFVRAGRVPGLARVLVAASGTAAVATAVASRASWGWASGAAWGAVVASCAGLTAAALAVSGVVHMAGRVRWVPLVGVAVGVLVLVVPAPGLGGSFAGRTSGPYIGLAELRDGEFRSGVRGLPASVDDLRLTVVEGRAAVATWQGLVTVDGRGRAEVLARLPSEVPGRVAREGLMLGVTGDRIARWDGYSELAIWNVTPGSPFEMRVTDVGEASRVGVDGSVWLRAFDDAPGTLRRLDVSAVRDGQVVDAVDLPAIEIAAPGNTSPGAVDLLPVDEGALTVPDDPRDGSRLVRLGAATATDGPVSETLAGGLDPACGFTSDSTASYLPFVPWTTLSRDDAGGTWFAIHAEPYDDRPVIAHLDSGGVLRKVAAAAPGRVAAMTLEDSGSLVLAIDAPEEPDALWVLPDAAKHLEDLPSPNADCVASPTPFAPPATLDTVSDSAGSRLGVPLGVDGRWADSSAGAGKSTELFVVDPDGDRTSVGRRRDGSLGSVVPDGTGGMWWVEVDETDPEDHRLVHGRPGEPEQRAEPVRGIDDYGGSMLIADLTGGPPLLGTPDGAFELVDGQARQVFDGPVDDGVIGPDGRGWLLSGGRLLSFDGQDARTVIDAVDTDTAPVSVQLRRGVRPEQLTLMRAQLGLDVDGRPLVVSDDVVLAVTDGGAVQVVAQDEQFLQMTNVYPVEGGTVVTDGSEHLSLNVNAT